MNEHFKCRSELEGKYSYIDDYFKESCDMSYSKAIELCQKGKEVHEKLNNTLPLIKIQEKKLPREGNQT